MDTQRVTVFFKESPFGINIVSTERGDEIKVNLSMGYVEYKNQHGNWDLVPMSNVVLIRSF